MLLDARPANLAAMVSTEDVLARGLDTGLAADLWGDSGVRGGVGGCEPGLEGPAGAGPGRSPIPRARADSDSRIFPATKEIKDNYINSKHSY